ncbi:MAG: hypothetical protein ACK46A_10780, partial [Akkermansiaceae bacterium]
GQLQRLYGTAFENKEELEQHLVRLEEAKKRDHRRLGRELGLFHIDEAVGQGLILWKPKGALIRRALQEGPAGPGVSADPTDVKGFYPYEVERGADIHGYWYKSPGD